MRILLLIIACSFSSLSFADEKEDAAVIYFKFLFSEEQMRDKNSEEIISKPLVSSFYSIQGHRMIAVSASTNSGKSYYALMSVNELNMGYLAWKQRGYGIDPATDIKYFMVHDGQEFDFEGW